MNKKYLGWWQVTCAAICGCCEAKFLFKTKERARSACQEASMKHAEIVDDTGHRETVDGFYGFDIRKVKKKDIHP